MISIGQIGLPPPSPIPTSPLIPMSKKHDLDGDENCEGLSPISGDGHDPKLSYESFPLRRNKDYKSYEFSLEEKIEVCKYLERHNMGPTEFCKHVKNLKPGRIKNWTFRFRQGRLKGSNQGGGRPVAMDMEGKERLRVILENTQVGQTRKGAAQLVHQIYNDARRRANLEPTDKALSGKTVRKILIEVGAIEGELPQKKPRLIGKGIDTKYDKALKYLKEVNLGFTDEIGLSKPNDVIEAIEDEDVMKVIEQGLPKVQYCRFMNILGLMDINQSIETSKLDEAWIILHDGRLIDDDKRAIALNLLQEWRLREPADLAYLKGVLNCCSHPSFIQYSTDTFMCYCV